MASPLIGGSVVLKAGITKPIEQKPGTVGEQINAMLIDSKGTVWAAAKRGLARLSVDTETWQLVKNRNFTRLGIIDPYFTSICEGPDGVLWFGTRRYGLCRFHPESGRLVLYDKDQVPDLYITSVCIDQKGFLWFGTYGAGLCRVDPGEIGR